MLLDAIECCTCSVLFTPSRITIKHCGQPCKARFCYNCNYKSVKAMAVKPLDATENLVEEPRLGTNEQRKAQMDELFHGYEATDPIVISNLPDGSRVVILSDIQIPFEERWLVSGTIGKLGAVEKFIEHYQPDILIYNGDIMDCYSISSFVKSPNRMWTLKEEVDLAKKMLDTHRSLAPKARMIFIDGNHEERTWRTLINIAQVDPRARELLGALNITSLTSKHLLGLEGRGIEWIPYGSIVDLLGFVVTHGDVVSQFSGFTARRMSDRYRSSGCSGHTHRLGTYYYTGNGITHCWMESGCLCRLDAEYVTNANWQNGWIIGEVMNNKFHPQLINAFDNKVYAAGCWF